MLGIQLSSDVEELLEIGNIRVFGGLCPKRSVPPLPGLPGDDQGHFLLAGLIKKGLGHLVGSIDELGGNAVAANPHEAVGSKRLSQFSNKAGPLRSIAPAIQIHHRYR